MRFILIVAFIFLSACVKKHQNTQLVIQLPKAELISKQSWLGSDPTQMQDIACYAVMIGGSEASLRDKSCKKSDGTELFKTGLFKGLYPAGAQVVVDDIPSGKAREIKLVGFAGSSSSVCAGLQGSTARSSLSSPYVVASTVLDLPPGDVTVNMSASVQAEQKFSTCDGIAFFQTTGAPSCAYPAEWSQSNHSLSGVTSAMAFEMSKALKARDGSLWVTAYVDDYALSTYHWYVLKSVNGGQSWVEADKVTVTSPDSLSQLGLVQGDDGAITAAYLHYQGANYSLIWRRSVDGTNWTTVQSMVLTGYFSFKDFIKLPNGTLLLYGHINNGSTYEFVTFSSASGGSWATNSFAFAGATMLMTLSYSNLVISTTQSLYLSGYYHDYASNVYRWFILQGNASGTTWNQVDAIDVNSPSYLQDIGLLQASDGAIVGAYSEGDGTNQWIKVRRSVDATTFSNVSTIAISSSFNVRGKLRLQNGGLIFYGVSYSSPLYEFATLTSATGSSWSYQGYTPTGLTSMMSMNFSSVLTSTDGKLYVSGYADDYSSGIYKWFVMASSNAGVSWSEVESITLPTTSGSLYSLGLLQGWDKAIYAAYSKYESSTMSYSLTIRRTADGSSWSDSVTLPLSGYFTAKEFTIDQTGNLILYGRMDATNAVVITSVTKSCQ